MYVIADNSINTGIKQNALHKSKILHQTLSLTTAVKFLNV